MPRKPNTQCLECGSQIYRRPSESGKYCSQECYGISRRTYKTCPQCSNEYRGSGKTCSRSCANKSRKGTKYRGRPLKDKVRDLRSLKQRAFSLRGAKCERCDYSESSNILVLHHILHRKDGGSDDLENLEILCPNCHALEHYGEDPAG